MQIESFLTWADWRQRCGRLRAFGTVAEIEGQDGPLETWAVRLATWTRARPQLEQLEALVFAGLETEGHLNIDPTTYLVLCFDGEEGCRLAEAAATAGSAPDTVLLADAYVTVGPGLGDLLSELPQAAGLDG